MSDLASQKRIAAAILKCGVNRVWFDPERQADIEAAISRNDLRELIAEGAIRAHPVKGTAGAGPVHGWQSVPTVTRKDPDGERVPLALEIPRNRHGCARSVHSAVFCARCATKAESNGVSIA